MNTRVLEKDQLCSKEARIDDPSLATTPSSRRRSWKPQKQPQQKRPITGRLAAHLSDSSMRPAVVVTARHGPSGHRYACSCTESVMMKVQILRSMGKERLEFGEVYPEGDLSYVEVKVRSAIMGGDVREQVRAINFPPPLRSEPFSSAYGNSSLP